MPLPNDAPGLPIAFNERRAAAAAGYVRFATGLVFLALASGCGEAPGPKTDSISPPPGPVDTGIGAGQTSKVDKLRCAGAFCSEPRTSGDAGAGSSPTSGN